MLPVVVGTCAGALTWEALWWLRRRVRRTAVHKEALRHATSLCRPLVVIGAPDGGMTSGYPCGDVTVDIQGSTCPRSIRADITQPLPFDNDSVVCFVSCVLEYVGDADSALREIHRISGGHAFYVGVEPWTFASKLYPGAKRTLPAVYR